MGAAAPIIGVALAVVGTAYQIKVAGDAADEQEEIRRQQQAAEAQKRMEERRASARRRRIARARVAQSSENTGAAGSSAEAGALGSINTQAAAERTGIAVREKASEAIGKSQQKLSELNVQGQIGQAATSLGTSIFAYGGGFNQPKVPEAKTPTGLEVNRPDSIISGP